MYQIKAVSDAKELEGIKALQEQNLVWRLSTAEAQSEGFVTAEYDLDYLRGMNQLSPAIIAKHDDQVVGYALATLREIGVKHDLLRDLFETIDKIMYDGTRLGDIPYIVVGQLCVAKDYRGKGIVRQLYGMLKDVYAGTFELCVTDVAESNPRSLKAHLKTGFQVIDVSNYGGTSWSIVAWDWRNLK